MSEDTRSPQINISKIVVGNSMAGAFVAVSSMAILLIGIPAIRYLFLPAIVLGCGVALFLHFTRHENPGKPWILAAPKK